MKFQDYKIQLYWSAPDRLWVAEMPEFPYCAGDGKTQVEALNALKETFNVLSETYAEEGLTTPKPARATLSVQTLKRSADVLKLSALARRAKINRNTLKSKLLLNRELSEQESEKIGRALAGSGIMLTR